MLALLRRRHMLFFFSSRRRHTRCLSDWSSDVCSSDLHERVGVVRPDLRLPHPAPDRGALHLLARALRRGLAPDQIGRASCRERAEIWEDIESIKKKKDKKEIQRAQETQRKIHVRQTKL